MRILITGGSGLLALNWALRCRDDHDVHSIVHHRDINLDGITTHIVGLDDGTAFQNFLERVNPDLVVHTAGLTNVEECEQFPQKSLHANVNLAKSVSLACAAYSVRLLHVSTDHLFDGKKAYIDEQAEIVALNQYARHKAAAETAVQLHMPNALIVRTSFFGWGPDYRYSLSDQIINSLKRNDVFTMFDDVFFTALSTGRLIDLSMDAVRREISGILNLCSGERISKYAFSVKIAKAFGYDPEVIQPIQASRMRGGVLRPLDLSLSNKRMLSLLRVSDINADDLVQDLKADKIAQDEIGCLGKIIPYGKHHIDSSDIAEVVKTLQTGPLTQGPKISKLEECIADYVGAKFAVCVSSATAGLHLTYMALGVSKGKTVLTSPNTFVSTANAAIFCGGGVAFADIDLKSLNMGVNAAAIAIAEDASIEVVAPVIFSGSATGISEICKLAKSAGKFVVEDAAHGLGGSYECGAKIGSCRYSDCTVFSLHPVKSIAAGEGGIITTNSEKIYRSLLRLRSHGINKSDDAFQNSKEAFTDGLINPWYYEMITLGYHYRLTDIQASLALSQMKKLDQFVERRRMIAHRYIEWMKNHANITRPRLVDINLSANHLFPIMIDFKSVGRSRNHIMHALRKKGIITQVHYIPVVNQPFYRSAGFEGSDFPFAQQYYESGLSLPLYFSMSDQDFGYVTSELSSLLEK